jgi:hypothetical protein
MLKQGITAYLPCAPVSHMYRNLGVPVIVGPDEKWAPTDATFPLGRYANY